MARKRAGILVCGQHGERTTHLSKEHQEAVDQQVVDVTRSMVASEVLLLSFSMVVSTTSVLVNERCDSARDQR